MVGIKINLKTAKTVIKHNLKYEQYLGKEIYGTDVITLINKAISNNETNKVEKDEKGFYINNEQDSIIIDLIMITDEEKQSETTYRMETIYKVGINEFIKNFNTAQFKCIQKEYHSATGQIAYIQLVQQAE